MHAILKILQREVLLRALFFLPEARRRRIERWLRGKEEVRKLRQADCVIVSYGKSGRTWLRAMLSRYFQVRHGLAKWRLLGFDNLHRQNPAIPKIFFTHDNYIKDYTGNADSKADFYDRKVVLLVRDPADTAVSQYFHWKNRMRGAKKRLNDYPLLDDEVTIYDFVMRPESGMPKIIDYLNLWSAERDRLGELLVIRYEDLRSHPKETLARILEFMVGPVDEAQVADAVDFGSFDNLKALEARQASWWGGGRLKPGDRSNPESFKVRRAKVGGYRDYFDEAQIAAIEAMIDKRLAPDLGYGPGDRQPVAAAG